MHLLPFYNKYFYLINNRKYKPCFILNIDEVSLSSTPVHNQLHVKIKDEILNSTPAPLKMSHSSILFTISADGSSYPTIVLVSQKQVPYEFQCISNENLRFLCSTK
jgi:hypothetical protein